MGLSTIANPSVQQLCQSMERLLNHWTAALRRANESSDLSNFYEKLKKRHEASNYYRLLNDDILYLLATIRLKEL